MAHLENRINLTFSFYTVSGLILAVCSIPMRWLLNGDLGRFVFYTGITICGLGLAFLLIRVLQVCERHLYLKLLIPSQKVMILRVSSAFYALLTFTPYMFLLNNEDPMILGSNVLFAVYHFFMLIFLPCLFPARTIWRKFVRKLPKEEDVISQDSLKALYFNIAILLIFFVNMSIIQKWNSNIYFESFPGVSIDNQNIGVLGLIFPFFALITVVIFLYYGTRSFGNLERLSLKTDIPDFPKNYYIKFFLYLLWFIISYLIFNSSIWIIINVAMLEGVFIWALIVMTKDAPEKSFLSRILYLTTIGLEFFTLVILIDVTYLSQDFRNILFLFLSESFVLFNYLLTNKFFNDFDFI
ncbi:MAG: hypothetical protein ACFFG0_48015, partial [Candidatus Thorarchaeota archaeon]